MSDVDTAPRPAAAEHRDHRLSKAGIGTVAVLVVLFVVGVWFYRGPLQPSVAGNPSGSWSAAPPDIVLVRTDLDVTGWPSVLLREVHDVPGAHVVGAWVVPDVDEAQTGTANDPEAGDAALGPDDSGLLPQRLERGTTQDLVIRWEITDCDALVEGAQPEVALRSVVGTTRTEALDGTTGPAFDLQVLVDTGICPD